MLRPKGKRRQILLLLLLFLLVLLLRSAEPSITSALLVQFYHLRYNLHGILYALSLASLLTKGPMLQIVSDDYVDVVFEIRHRPARFFTSPRFADQSAVVHYTDADDKDLAAGTGSRRAVATMKHDEMEIFVYRARLSNVYLALSSLAIQIEIGSFKSPVFRYASLSEREGPLRIGVLGDNQFAAATFSRVLRQMTRTCRRVDMLIHVGDAVQDAVSARSWQTDFFDPLDHHNLLSLPIALLRGNHDSPSAYTSAPQEPASVPGYTSFTIRSVFFVVLDSNIDSELQDRFLATTLASDAAQGSSRRVVLVHIPPFVEYWSPASWRAGERLWGDFVRTRYVRLFEDFRVDLVLSGHQHNYQRSQKRGVTYIIAGGSGGTLDREVVEDYSINQVTVLQHHFGVLEIVDDGGGGGRDVLHWRMYLMDGTLGDKVIL